MPSTRCYPTRRSWWSGVNIEDTEANALAGRFQGINARTIPLIVFLDPERASPHACSGSRKRWR